MNASELLLTAKTIAHDHFTSGIDLNDSITKIASTQSLSKPQIERLVEETNKATFLELFEKKAEQEFPVADYQTIKSKLTPKFEKTAAQKLVFAPLTYSDSLFSEQVGKERINDKPIEKTADTLTLTEDEIAHIEALEKVAYQFWEHYNTFRDLEALGQKRYGDKHHEASDLIKVAEIHHDTEILQLQELQTTLNKEAAVFEIILNRLDKVAGLGSSLMWGNTNPINAFKTVGGGLLNRTAHAAGSMVNFGAKHTVGTAVGAVGAGLKLGLKGAAVASPVLVPLALRGAKSNLNATLTVGHELPGAINKLKGISGQSNYIGPGFRDALGMEKNALLEEAIPAAQALFKTPLVQGAVKWGSRALGVSQAASKLIPTGAGFLGPAAKTLNPLTALASEGVSKQAGLVEGLQHALEFITPAALWGAQAGPMGALAGFTAAAAKKLGGGIALTMNKNEFDNSFETIMKNNPDLAENKKQMRGYFDVVSRHAPSLAKDPLVAESIVKNMNAFGGTDYNTIRGLRETEALGRGGPSEKGLSGLTALFGRS